jgi:hypothetical protein
LIHLQQRVADIVKKRNVLDGRMAFVYEKREKKRTIRKTEKDMNLSDKWSNVQRMKRIDEFVRLQVSGDHMRCCRAAWPNIQCTHLSKPCAQTLQKIQDDDDRSQRMKREKQQLLEQRKMAALQSLMQKHKITTAMDQMRISNKWGSLDKLIDGPAKKGKKGAGDDPNGESLPNLPQTR